MQLTAIALSLSRIYGPLGGGAFTPATLFANSEPGVWFDPSDLTTLFQDSAGTTPVTAVEQPVGLMLDKSNGLVLGPELVTNGDFSNGTTGWTAGSGGAISADTTIFASGIKVTGGGSETTAGAQQVLSGFVVGKRYRVSTSAYAASGNSTPNSATISLKSAPLTIDSSSSAQVTASGVIQTLSFVFVATATSHTIYGFVLNRGVAWGNTSSFAYFDNISVRELPGNHAYQTTSTSRPVLSARYNLLTKTERFDDSAWAKTGFLAFGSGSVANATSAPNSTTTADLLVPNTTANVEHYVDIGSGVSIAITSGSSYTISWCGKAAGYKWLRLAFSSAIAPTNERAAWFDVEAGEKGTTQNNVTSTIESLPNGFYRCTITRAATATATLSVVGFAMITNADQGLGFTANGTSGMYFWGASLVPANQASLPYQRVNTATDYDTVGFPKYLKFDGSDDWLVTPTITPGIDKVQVFAGVRRLVDTAGIIAELSNNWNNNAGSFLHWGGANNNGTGNGFNAASRGSVGSSAAQFGYTQSVFTPPVTAVTTSTHDIAGDLTVTRGNGVSGTNGTGDKGTGNFGNYPLYIGRRGGTDYPFNGYIYSLIIRFGANLDEATVGKVETYVANKTGITL